MFPGQGAQVTGMGKAFYDEYECSRKCFDTASEVVGFSLRELIFNEDDRLDKTEYTQIALYTTEMSILAAVEEMGFKPDVNIGLSLGEYSAITASGALDFADGCSLVRKRGSYMEQAVPQGIGAMAAVLGMTAEQVEEVVEHCNSGSKSGGSGEDSEITGDCGSGKSSEVGESSKDHECGEGIRERLLCVANYNCPGQVVISGERNQVLHAMEALKAAGAKRVVELNCSGPFHSPMLAEAGEKLGEALEAVNFGTLEMPYVANLTADYVTDTKNIKELLKKQVYSSVRFEQSVRRLINDGVDTFVEIGPGRTLAGFVKKIAKDMGVEAINIKNVEKPEDLEALAQEA